ncbi:MAG TPA: hypothetical protein VEB43_07725 [Anaeromyxobacter sp.]|nr:hypothetical protein [Anaeromyxobacter sp.]
MLFMDDGRSGLLGGGRGRGQAWSPELAALVVAAVVLLALVL